MILQSKNGFGYLEQTSPLRLTSYGIDGLIRTRKELGVRGRINVAGEIDDRLYLYGSFGSSFSSDELRVYDEVAGFELVAPIADGTGVYEGESGLCIMTTDGTETTISWPMGESAIASAWPSPFWIRETLNDKRVLMNGALDFYDLTPLDITKLWHSNGKVILWSRNASLMVLDLENRRIVEQYAFPARLNRIKAIVFDNTAIDALCIQSEKLIWIHIDATKKVSIVNEFMFHHDAIITLDKECAVFGDGKLYRKSSNSWHSWKDHSA